MRANNTKPGVGKYTSMREKYKREAQEKPKPRYNPPKFPYTYDKNARVSFLDQVQVLPYKEIATPHPLEIPLPIKLLSEMQLLWLLGVRVHVKQP
jgi:hypothetical protein